MGFKNAEIRAGLPNNSPGDLQAGWRGPGCDGPRQTLGVKAATDSTLCWTPRPCGLHPGPSGSPGAHGTEPMAMPAVCPQHVGSGGHRQWHRSVRCVPVPAATDMLVPVGRREAGWCVFITRLPALAVGSEAVPVRAMGPGPPRRQSRGLSGPPAWPHPRQDPAGSPQLGLHPRPLPGPRSSQAVPEAFLMLFHETRVLNPELWPRSGRSAG